LIFIQENDGGLIVIRMELPSREERLKYRCSLVVCSNPLCDCKELTLRMCLDKELSSASGPEKVTVSFDIHDKKLNTDRILAGDIPFARRILEQMDDSDWKILWQTYFALKVEYGENTPIEKLDFDFKSIHDLDYITIDGGKMVPFDEIFPFSEEYVFEINGKNCIVLPVFCLARGCKCTKAVLEIQVIENQELSLSVYVDYKKGTFSNFERDCWDSDEISLDIVKNSLQTAFPYLCQRLEEKHRRLSKLYQISRAKYYKGSARKADWDYDDPFDDPGETFRWEEEKVGRNDPCPCGSGKKYKKCCLK